MASETQPVTAPPAALARDADSVYRVVTAVATHTDGWEQAAVVGITELAKSISDLRVARVAELDTVVRDGGVAAYRVKLQVSYRIDRRRTTAAGVTQTVRRYLVVVNQNVASAALSRTLGERMAAGPSEFHILVPTGVGPLAATALMADPLSGFAAVDNSSVVAAHEEMRQEANELLADHLARVRASGAHATGEVAQTDPVHAVAAVLERASFDEIILSTPPAHLSRWARLDLPHRLHRRFALPVTHVEQRD
jgi:flavin-binding protein dodecin